MCGSVWLSYDTILAGARGASGGKESEWIDVIYGPRGPGWGPLRALAELAADQFGSKVETIGCGISRRRRECLEALVPRRRGGGRVALYISPKPASLEEFGIHGLNRRGYDRVAAWAIDSSWHDRIRRTLGMARHFDHIYVIRHDDQHVFEEASGVPVGVLPRGTDVLRAVNQRVPKEIDSLRFGRQPPAWRGPGFNNSATSQGLTVGVAPPQGPDSLISHRKLMPTLASARAILAFSCLSDDSEYTHPTQDYLTGRGTDALGHRCMVFGKAPSDRTSQELLWGSAVADVSPIDVARGLEQIRDRLASLTADDSLMIQREAARRLDWRWRLARIDDDLGIQSTSLRRQLDELAEWADAAGPAA